MINLKKNMHIAVIIASLASTACSSENLEEKKISQYEKYRELVKDDNFYYIEHYEELCSDYHYFLDGSKGFLSLNIVDQFVIADTFESLGNGKEGLSYSITGEQSWDSIFATYPVPPQLKKIHSLMSFDDYSRELNKISSDIMGSRILTSYFSDLSKIKSNISRENGKAIIRENIDYFIFPLILSCRTSDVLMGKAGDQFEKSLRRHMLNVISRGVSSAAEELENY